MGQSRAIAGLVALTVSLLAMGVARAQGFQPAGVPCAEERYRHAREVLERQRKLEVLPPALRLAQWRDEGARQRFEKRLQEERARRRADPGPYNLISTAYTQYSFIQLCHQVRQGYAMINISDDELQRARTAAKAIEKAAIAKDPTINLDEEFADPDRDARSMFSIYSADKQRIGDMCRKILDVFLSSSPVSPYQTQRP